MIPSCNWKGQSADSLAPCFREGKLLDVYGGSQNPMPVDRGPLKEMQVGRHVAASSN